MTGRRFGVIGGGLIAQAVHLPNLRSNPAIDIVSIADPSAQVAHELALRYGIPMTYLDWREMLDRERLDAIVICSPHSTHAAIVLAAIELGIHCLVEKPLCIDPADGRRIELAAAAAGVVVQVGYMKRFDPAYQRFLEQLPAGDDVRLIDVVTYDPWMSREPYVPWRSMIRADDIPASVIDAGRADEAAQVGAAVGADDPATVRAFSYTFLACLIHDVNLVHGILDRWGLGSVPVSSSAWADGDAASATLQLGNGAQWRTSWMLLPGLERFDERVSVYFADSIHELNFPVPYHGQSPTVRHVLSTDDGRPVDTAESFVDNSYVAELAAFVTAIDTGAPVLTPPGQSVVDLTTLRDLYLLRDQTGLRDQSVLRDQTGDST